MGVGPLKFFAALSANDREHLIRGIQINFNEEALLS